MIIKVKTCLLAQIRCSNAHSVLCPDTSNMFTRSVVVDPYQDPPRGERGYPCREAALSSLARQQAGEETQPRRYAALRTLQRLQSTLYRG